MKPGVKRPDVTLVLLLKRPLPGYGKQRLADTLGTEAAVRIATGLLACALEDAVAWPGPLVLSPAREEDADWAAALLERPAEVLAQSSGNLGARINVIDRRLRERGHQRLLFMGSDAPSLQPVHFEAAQRVLLTQEVVLSAAADGGVVLMGNRVPWPELSALPWSTEQLGSALRQRCERAGLVTRYIQPGYDIDVEADLRGLQEDLAGDPRPARQHLLRELDTLWRAAPTPPREVQPHP